MSEKLQEKDVMDALDAVAKLLRAIANNELDATVSAETAEAALEKLAVARRMAFDVIYGYYGDGYMSGMKDAKTNTASWVSRIRRIVRNALSQE